MNNLISVFMNYKVNRLIEYGVLCYEKNTPFIRNVFQSYFQTYIDNYYYGVFNTLEEENYNRRNLKLEFTGIMEEMLYDYQEYEHQVSSEEYVENQKIIKDLRDIASEIVRIDSVSFSSKEEVFDVMHEFLQQNPALSRLFLSKEDKLIRMVRETYTNESRLLQYENQSFTFQEKKFIGRDDCVWYELIPNMKSLEIYRKGLVEKVNHDDKLAESKLECFIQMVSHQILLNFFQKKETKKIFMELPSCLVSRGRINDRIYSLFDNPMFQKYVVIVIPYNTFLSQRNAFLEDFHFACMQDFRHINDVFQKVEAIYNEGFCHYLIVSDYKEDDKDFFLNYKNDVMSVLMFEED